MTQVIFLISYFIFSISGSADNEFAVSKIPEELKKGADAVVRMDKMELTIKSEDKATLYVKTAITILDEDGILYAIFRKDYDQFRTIKNLKGRVYDEFGEEVKKLKREDVIDRAISGSNFVSNSRIKAADLTYTKYPYTIEYEYSMEYDGLFAYPSWYVLPAENLSVQNTSYKVIYPPELKPRFKEVNFGEEIPVLNESREDQFYWSAQNIQAMESEPYSKGIGALSPFVLVAPNDFMLDGRKGKMNSWEDFGKWNYTLNEGRDQLPDETIIKIRELVSDAANIQEKVKIIYEYMQSRTRYVSIQLGIGGWQTYEADFVDEKGWGDCKALSNYTMALLKAVDIDSYWALVQAGRTTFGLQTDFPSVQFNHVILSVPMENDTLWLECTSQQMPCGYLGTFTGDRDVLLVTESGGKIVHTPVLDDTENLQTRIADINLDASGNAQATIVTHYTGIQYENDDINFMIHKSPQDQKKWLYKRIGLPGFEINNFSFKETKSEHPEIEEKLELAIRDYANTSGKRVFINLNSLNRREYVPKKIERRKTEVLIRNGYTDIDTIRFHIPEGIHPEYTPEDEIIESEFGSYEMHVIVEQGLITYVRRLNVRKDIYPSSSYDALVEFYKKIAKADKSRAVFLKST